MVNCRPYFIDELKRLKRLRVVVPLGQIGFTTFLKARKEMGMENPRPLPKFGHARSIDLPDGIVVIGSYHPSQQNTFTGRLPEEMLDDVFRLAKGVIEKG
jgi:uracil-DNA glycosylase